MKKREGRIRRRRLVRIRLGLWLGFWQVMRVVDADAGVKCHCEVNIHVHAHVAYRTD